MYGRAESMMYIRKHMSSVHNAHKLWYADVGAD